MPYRLIPYKVSLEDYMRDPKTHLAQAGKRPIAIQGLTKRGGLMSTALIIAGVLSVLSLLWSAYSMYALFPFEVVKVTRASVRGGAVRVGEPVVVDFDYCKYTDFDSVAVSVVLKVGGRIVTVEPDALPRANVNAPLGCHSTSLRAFTMPLAMPIESYALQASAVLTYDFISSLRSTRQSFQTEPFVVMPPLNPPPAVAPLVQSLEQ